MLNPNGLYFAYLRKSREDREAELRGDGETLARHRRILSDLACYYGITIAKWYEEVVSGDTIAARPQMMALLSDIENRRPEGVLAVEISRLARGDTRDQGLIMETFKYAGTQIITPLKLYDPANESDEEYAEFGLFMSRREYKAINRRLQNGRYSSFHEGKWTGNKAPYGYERIKIPNGKGWTLKIEPEEAAIVKLIFDLYVEGGMQSGHIPVGTSAICCILDSMGVAPPEANQWQPSAVRTILENVVYMGKLRLGHRPRQKKTLNGVVTVSRPVNKTPEIRDGLHPPIIDEITFEKAQKKRRASYRKPFFQGIKNPLAGIIRCGECGKSMYRRPSGPRCPEDMILCRTRGCPTSASYYSLVEDRLLKSLSEWLGEAEIQVKDMAGENAAHELEVLWIRLERCKGELETAQKQLSKAMELLEQDVYTIEMFRQRAAEHSERIAAAEREITQVTEQIESVQMNLSCRKGGTPRFEGVLSLYPQITDPAVKNALLKQILVRVDYYKPHKGNRFTGGQDSFTLDIYPRL